jgi:BirA family biotin operon repressor/biotin-[acetyl-CoA-carboxylase] ligase
MDSFSINTQFVGQNFITLNEIDSTNNYAIQLCRQSVMPEGTIISTGKQSAGKGRNKNTWQTTENQNITLSLILHPSFIPIEDQFLISMMTCLALRLTLNRFTSSKIKWPNDLLVDNKKIAGILIENIIQGIKIKYCVIGIGININQINFPFEIKNKSTSLKLILGKNQNLRLIIKDLCINMEKYYLKLKNNPSKIHNEYLEALTEFGASHSFIYREEKIEAKIIHVRKNGLMDLKLKNHQSISVNIDEVKQIY